MFQLYHKLVLARDTRAIVICSPSALKSFMLKLVESLHLLDQVSELTSNWYRCAISNGDVHIVLLFLV